eukprot:15352224-Alexandrium_andersonii.AAC.1
MASEERSAYASRGWSEEKGAGLVLSGEGGEGGRWCNSGGRSWRWRAGAAGLLSALRAGLGRQGMM